MPESDARSVMLTKTRYSASGSEVRESGGGGPSSAYGICGRKARSYLGECLFANLVGSIR